MRATFAAAAQIVVQDIQTNNVSLINILESLTLAGFPTALSPVSFVATWEREAADPAQVEGDLVLRLGNEVLTQLHITVNFNDGLRTRTVFVIGALFLGRPGSLVFSIVLNGGVAVEYPVEINGPAVTGPTVTGPRVLPVTGAV
jgi:hypothetical protein